MPGKDTMRKRPDYSVLIGWSIGLIAIIGCAALEGIRLSFLWQPTAALVVFGGTVGAVIVKRGIGGIRQAARAAFNACFHWNNDEMEAASARLIWLARVARRDGARAFESHAEVSQDPLIAHALSLTADYTAPAEVRIALDRMLDEEDEQGLRDVATLDAAGGYAPTFGIIGAVLGLIYVLRSIADPAALGSGIATAFVATLYGLGSANLLLFPLAARLRERHGKWMKQREALADALVALSAHESPSTVAAHLASRAGSSVQDFDFRKMDA